MFASQIDDALTAPVGFDVRALMRRDGPRSRSGRAPAPNLLLRVLDEINHGLMLVTESGDVAYANRVAIRDCGADQPLQYDGQRLNASRAADRESLARALTGARDGRRTILVVRSASASASIGVIPVSDDLADATGDAAVALLVFGKRSHCDPLSLQFFAQMHRLTPAESGVLKGLCEGLRPTEVAQRGGVALSTVRSQISNIRQKTRASSVDHVVRMVQLLPPVVPALYGQRAGAAAE